MRRIPLALLMLLAFAATTSAQAVFQPIPPPAPPPPPNVRPQAQPDDMVARLMSFDRNADGKVTKDEVLERMEHVVVDGDADHDGALDRAEIRAIAERPPTQGAVRGFQAGHYTFSDESGVSSRLRIDGALDDLRLAGPVKEDASAVVTAFVDALEKEASADLVKEMAGVLPPAQLTRLEDALKSQSQIRTLKMGNDGSRVAILIGDVNRPNVAFMVAMAPNDRALAALETFNARLRPGDAERSALLEKLRDVLNDEQRDDFRAALERRPVIKAGGGIVAGGVAAGVVGAVPITATLPSLASSPARERSRKRRVRRKRSEHGDTEKRRPIVDLRAFVPPCLTPLSPRPPLSHGLTS